MNEACNSYLVRLNMRPESNPQPLDSVDHPLAVSANDGCVEHNSRLGHIGQILADIELLQGLFRGIVMGSHDVLSARNAELGFWCDFTSNLGR